MISLIEQIEKCANTVYKELGAGHTESVYHKALLVELRLNDIPCESEVITPITYKGQFVGYGRADIVVDHKIAVELKAMRDIGWADNLYRKLNAYMKSLKLGRGLMINFIQRSGRADCEIIRFKCSQFLENDFQ